MNLTVKIDHPDNQGSVQFRTAFDGEAMHVERILRRNGLSYERCLEIVTEVEKFLLDLGRRFEVSEAEARQAEESAIHAVTVLEVGRLRGEAIHRREEEKRKAEQAAKAKQQEADKR